MQKSFRSIARSSDFSAPKLLRTAKPSIELFEGRARRRCFPFVARYAARGREDFQSSTSSSHHATLQAPSCIRLGNWPAFSQTGYMGERIRGFRVSTSAPFFDISFLTCCIDVLRW